MIQSVHINEPDWLRTLPHRVVPYHDEWLPGLLLRCDEVNHWEGRVTLTHLLSPGPEKFHRCWRTETPHLVMIQPRSLKLDYLTQLLALPATTLLSTTYHTELTHLYGETKLHPHLLSTSFTFRLCPQCIAEARILRRSLLLPHITICPQHHVALVERCQCGALLQLFHRQALPFTCHVCGLDWAELPRIEITPTYLTKEQEFLRWYEFLFSQEAPPITRDVLQFMVGSILKRSLSSLITVLVERRRFPHELLNWVDRQSRL